MNKSNVMGFFSTVKLVFERGVFAHFAFLFKSHTTDPVPFAVIVGIFILGIVYPLTREYFFANPLLFVLILMVIYGVKEWILTQTLNNVWRSFARKTGLTFASVRSLGIPFIKQPQIEGVYHDHPMLIRKFHVSAGEDTKLFTAIEISLSGNHVPKMEIYTRTRLSAARRAPLGEGKQFVPVNVDDDKFEKELFVKSESESFAQAVLSAEGLRDHLLSIESLATDMRIIVKDNKLLYLEKNLIRDNAYLLAVTDILIALAGQIEQTAVGRIVTTGNDREVLA